MEKIEDHRKILGKVHSLQEPRIKPYVTRVEALVSWFFKLCFSCIRFSQNWLILIISKAISTWQVPAETKG
jgi:hypothetical protein